PTAARPGLLCNDRDDPARAADAVRLCHQYQPATSTHRRAAAGADRCRSFDRQGAGEHKYFDVIYVIDNEPEFDRLIPSSRVLFAIEIPANFERAVRRGDRPALLVAADATDPVASSSAMAALGPLVQTALAHDRAVPDGGTPPFEIRTHAR